jgi:signal transduction histidine kinase
LFSTYVHQAVVGRWSGMMARSHYGPPSSTRSWRRKRGLAVDYGEVSVEVVDDGRGAAARDHNSLVANELDAPSGGHGLIGMRERVEMWGGTLETGPVDGGGFRVGASLPNAATT